MTAHDGFTLADLVSYNDKHNEANGEDNRDGHDHNNSWNCGIEGTIADPEIRRLRLKQRCNLIGTLLLSQGVPMLLAGDEFGWTQGGNNNAYCQDNELSWIDWRPIDGEERPLVEFVRALIRLRRDHIVFHRRRFFHARFIPGTEIQDITWLRPDGDEMIEADWADAEARCLGFLIRGEAGQHHLTAWGEPQPEDSFFVALNASHEPVARVISSIDVGHGWERDRRLCHRRRSRRSPVPCRRRSLRCRTAIAGGDDPMRWLIRPWQISYRSRRLVGSLAACG